MYEKGNIVLIPVPFSDLSSSKKRPVLIISSNEYNKLTDEIVVMAITSKITAKKYCVDIEDTIDGELPAKSQIRTDDGASNILNEDSLNNFNGNYGFDNNNKKFLADAFVLPPHIQQKAMGWYL